MFNHNSCHEWTLGRIKLFMLHQNSEQSTAEMQHNEGSEGRSKTATRQHRELQISTLVYCTAILTVRLERSLHSMTVTTCSYRLAITKSLQNCRKLMDPRRLYWTRVVLMTTALWNNMHHTVHKQSTCRKTLPYHNTLRSSSVAQCCLT